MAGTNNNDKMKNKELLTDLNVALFEKQKKLKRHLL